MTAEIQSDWMESKGGLTSRGAAAKGQYSYLSQYGRFIQERYIKFFPQWTFYNEVKILHNLLADVQSAVRPVSLKDLFVELLESKCDTSQTRVPRLATLCLSWAHTWCPWRTKLGDPIVWEKILMVGFEACLPTVQDECEVNEQPTETLHFFFRGGSVAQCNQDM